MKQTVCIPDEIRSRNTHLIARHGMGKSTLLEHMVVRDLDRGHGVAVLDPHGDLMQRLLRLIPEQHVERTIFLDPGDPEWVPLWNPLSLSPGQDISRTAGLAMAFKLALSAEQHWKKVTASHLVALVRAGVTFKDGVQIATHHTEEPSNQMARRIAG